MRYVSLYVYHFVYFLMVGVATFVPKFYGEIGMTDGQIGYLTSVPTLVALAISPMLGTLADRVSKKRHLLSFLLLMMAAACFLAGQSVQFLPLLAAISFYTVFYTSAQPLSTTISLEYTREVGKPYGPIRLLGTVGYQLGALLVGVVLSHSLRNLYPLMGAVLLIAFGITFTMPNVEGHQHSHVKIPLSTLFADRHVRWLYLMIFVASISTQFYMSFFTKHLGDLGMSNSVVSWITLLSVIAELPFLYFADRIARKTNIWNWVLIGMAANGIRWLGLAFSKSAVPIILFQIPGVTVLACFEFFPSLYLNRRVPAEQSGAAQNTLSLTIFGAGKIVGSLIGGQICERTGIPALMAFNGAALLVCCGILWFPTRKLIQKETVLKIS